MTDSGLQKKGSINIPQIYWSLGLSLFILLISIIFGNIFGAFTNAGEEPNFKKALENYNEWWWYPIFAYAVFVFLILWVKRLLDSKLAQTGLTKAEITKIIDKFSGIVDGIGTTLPLIGAAVILFTVGLGQQSQALFLEVAIPFEIKSLFILAIAKLFESAFDDLEIQYLRYAEDDEDTLGSKDMKVELINLPNQTELVEIQKVLSSWNETIDKMKDPEFKKNLDTITKIIGK